MNYTPTAQEYFEQAWQSAVEDKSVDATCRDKYTFQFICIQKKC